MIAGLSVLSSADATTIYKLIKPATRAPNDWVKTYASTITEEVVLTVTSWLDLPPRTATATATSEGVYDLKPAFRPTVAGHPVEQSADVLEVTDETMSYLTLLGVLLLVFGVVCVVNAVAIKVYKKTRASKTGKEEGGSPRKNGKVVRCGENRKRERPWRYRMSGFMQRPEGAGEAEGKGEENEKVWEDVEE